MSTLTQFPFVISDSTPPTFGVSCPGGPLLWYAEQDKFSALVNWTEPVAIDNAGVTPTVTSNYQTPQRFSQGSHVITYTAVDQSGNKATCTFTVKVVGKQYFSHYNRHFYVFLIKGCDTRDSLSLSLNFQNYTI